MSNQTSEPTPMKDQAQEIITSVERDLQRVESAPPAVLEDAEKRANSIVDKMFSVVSDVDMKAAVKRVTELKQQNPDVPPELLAQKLIRDKCQRTASVGAVTASAGIVPGIGTAAAITLGTAADIGVTFKMQAELVLEMAALYDYPLTEEEKQRLVMVITGISAGTSMLATKAGQNIALKSGERFASRTLLKAVPIAGVIASAGTNVLSTYIIGQRADAYFRLGPEAVGSWADTLRTISGVDERRIGTWLADSSKATGQAIVAGAGKVGAAGAAAGSVVVSGAGRVAGTVGPAVSAGVQKAGSTTQRGVTAYLAWVKKFWLGFFGLVRRILSGLWQGITYVPRKIGSLFRRRSAAPPPEDK